ncbi:MAG TPA: RMD1 family protein [Candidatus Binataceae bacterium]|nr:RMD1 family protein [Candidatus Binataceae bacterium]
MTSASSCEVVETTRQHQFSAIAFEENFALRTIARAFPGARLSALELYIPSAAGAGVYIYPFGAVASHDLSTEQREAIVAQLRQVVPKLTAQVVREEYTVTEDPRFETRVVEGGLHLDRLTQGRAAVVALTIAQSAAMEYYERIVDEMFVRTAAFVERLERSGRVSLRTRPLHRFIGQAIATRTEVLSVLHLLDKPEATWEDPAMDRIYSDLRAEFDLVDRYAALELKLRSIQEALELLLGVARDRQLLLLEVAVAGLILLELILGVLQLMNLKL